MRRSHDAPRLEGRRRIPRGGAGERLTDVLPSRVPLGRRATTSSLSLLALIAFLTACGGEQRGPAAPEADVTVAASVSSVSSPSVRWLPSQRGVELACDVT